MENRIKDFRKQRGMTLIQLATEVGTTPQSISRLENGVMTLSTDWLMRFAEVFHVHPTDLLEQPEQKSAPLMGEVGARGLLSIYPTARPKQISLESAAQNPVALRITENIGQFQNGDVLICDRLAENECHKAIGRNCLVDPYEETPLLCRVLEDRKKIPGLFILVPLTLSQPVLFAVKIKWAAPLIMRITYL